MMKTRRFPASKMKPRDDWLCDNKHQHHSSSLLHAHRRRCHQHLTGPSIYIASLTNPYTTASSSIFYSATDGFLRLQHASAAVPLFSPHDAVSRASYQIPAKYPETFPRIPSLQIIPSEPWISSSSTPIASHCKEIITMTQPS